MRRRFFNDKDLPFTFLRKGEGFTLIESMVMLTIMVILSVATIPFYQSAKKQLALQRSASIFAQDVRSTIEKAMSAQETGCSHPNYEYGYGVSLKEGDKEEYILFSDCNGNGIYEPGNDEFITQRFEDVIEIKVLNHNNLSIVFTPPDPTVTIKDSGNNDYSVAEITIGIIGEVGGITKTITINKAGLIDID